MTICLIILIKLKHENEKSFIRTVDGLLHYNLNKLPEVGIIEWFMMRTGIVQKSPCIKTVTPSGVCIFERFNLFIISMKN